MNRREAIRAVIAMPAVHSITVATVSPDDVIVVECDQPLTDYMAMGIKRQLQQVWPGRKVVVLCAGLKLRIARAV